MTSYNLKNISGEIVNRAIFDSQADADQYAMRNGLVAEASISEAELAANLRKQRNQLLTESDWTQVAGAPVDQAAWATYRQALRDIPQQAGFPHDITWPTKPE